MFLEQIRITRMTLLLHDVNDIFMIFYDLTYLQKRVVKIVKTYFVCRMIIPMNKMIANSRISGVHIGRSVLLAMYRQDSKTQLNI